MPRPSSVSRSTTRISRSAISAVWTGSWGSLTERNRKMEKILEMAAAFADGEIRPRAAEFDATGILPRDVIDGLAGGGFLAAPFPKKYGGSELGPVEYGLLTEEIGKACCSTRALMTVHTCLVGQSILRWGTE